MAAELDGRAPSHEREALRQKRNSDLSGGDNRPLLQEGTDGSRGVEAARTERVARVGGVRGRASQLPPLVHLACHLVPMVFAAGCVGVALASFQL